MSETIQGAPDSREIEQQREEEALAVITENDNNDQMGQAESDQAKGATETAPNVEANDHQDDTKHQQDTETQQQQQQQQQPPQHNQPIVEGSGGGGGAGCVCDSEPKEEPKQVGGEEQLKQTEDKDQEDPIKADKSISVGTSTVLVETQEVVSSSTTSHHQHPRKQSASGRVRSASRRASYQSNRSYSTGTSYQNYGLTYLPYKSNFEPSEDARRRADEYFKTLKL